MKKSLTFFLVLFYKSYNISTHNILRLRDTRVAKFILRHENKTHVAPHYKEFNIADEAACINQCVIEPECKSINFYKASRSHDADDENQCQLVDKDITDKNEYTDRQGWRHFDTGKSKITRLKHPDGFCYVPNTTLDKSCHFDEEMNIELMPITSMKCQSVSAYYEFDRASGIVVHLCSGTVLCPNDQTTSQLFLKDVWNCTYADLSIRSYKFRINMVGFLEFYETCVGPHNEMVRTGKNFILTDSCHDPSSQMEYDFEKGPIKVSIIFNLKSKTFTNFEAAIRARQGNPDEIVYLDVFMSQSKTYRNYGARWQSLFQAPISGRYTFWLKAMDYSTFYMSSDDTEISKSFCTSTEESSSFIWSSSCRRVLVKGKKYYMELLTYKGPGEDGDWQFLWMTLPNEETKQRVAFEDLEPHMT